jgi:hypothetical protein
MAALGSSENNVNRVQQTVKKQLVILKDVWNKRNWITSFKAAYSNELHF